MKSVWLLLFAIGARAKHGKEKENQDESFHVGLRLVTEMSVDRSRMDDRRERLPVTRTCRFRSRRIFGRLAAFFEHEQKR